MSKKSRAQAEAEALKDNYEKARALYATLVSLTDGPADAADIIMMMHMLLFLNNAQAGVAVDTMLKSYCDLFKSNYEAQLEGQAEDRVRMN